MAKTDTHPLPDSGYGEVVRIIQGYAEVGGPATLKDVGTRVGVADTTVSGNNKFLVACGIIEGGKQKQVTELGESLARAIQYEQEDAIRQRWRDCISHNELFEKVLSAIRIRKGMDEGALETHIAYTAGQNKSPRIMTGARAVVEILRAADLVYDDGDKVIARPEKVEDSAFPRREASGGDRTSEFGRSITTDQSAMPTPAEVHKPAGIVLHVNVEIRVDCAVEQLDALGPKLKALGQSLAEAGLSGEVVARS